MSTLLYVGFKGPKSLQLQSVIFPKFSTMCIATRHHCLNSYHSSYFHCQPFYKTFLEGYVLGQANCICQKGMSVVASELPAQWKKPWPISAEVAYAS